MRASGWILSSNQGSAEHGHLGALQLSLANLSDGMPTGFAELYRELMLQKVTGPGDARRLLQRLENAMEFVSII